MSTSHNHPHCIDQALSHAQHICQNAGVKLTPLREQVLTLVWQHHTPLGAYDLIEQLATSSDRRVAPPTIYRVLDFLLQMGMVHRINSLNAYIGCPSPTTTHPSYFFICTQCKMAKEHHHSDLDEHIQQLGANEGFTIEKQCLEILGVCKSCQHTPEKLKQD